MAAERWQPVERKREFVMVKPHPYGDIRDIYTLTVIGVPLLMMAARLMILEMNEWKSRYQQNFLPPKYDRNEVGSYEDLLRRERQQHEAHGSGVLSLISCLVIMCLSAASFYLIWKEHVLFDGSQGTTLPVVCGLCHLCLGVFLFTVSIYCRYVVWRVVIYGLAAAFFCNINFIHLQYVPGACVGDFVFPAVVLIVACWFCCTMMRSIIRQRL